MERGIRGIHCGKCIKSGQKGLIKGCKTYQRNKLVAENLGLVGSIAKKFKGSGVPMADIIQLGTEGLISAAEKYDPEIGQFSTYATYWIRVKIMRGTIGYKNVPMTARISETLMPVKRFIDKFQAQNNQYPTTEEIVESVRLKDCTNRRLKKTLEYNTYRSVDLSTEYLPSNRDTPEKCYEIKELLAHLTTDEKQIIRQRCNGYTFNEIGEELGLSTEKVRAIRTEGLKKISKIERSTNA